MNNLTVAELCGLVILLGGVLGVFAKWVYPAIKLIDRVSRLEEHEKKTFNMIERNEQADKLLCKAMLSLIDNKLTNNNIDGLRIVKADLLDFITKG